MHRQELRRRLLKEFYDKEDGRYHDPFNDLQTGEEKVAIETACYHLRDEGLIEWTMAIGHGFTGHGKITGRGVTYCENMEKPPVAHIQIGTAHNFQIGDGNTMNVADVNQRVTSAIEASNASLEQKIEAKSLWAKITNNQSFAAIVGAIAGAAVSFAKNP